MAEIKIIRQKNKRRSGRVLTFSCVDGQGNRLVLFLQGCNFDCITCHNPHHQPQPLWNCGGCPVVR
ncbi:4Fe-4S cluster-binding domain-containing protein [Vibrio lentus]|nr:4Fe-4S cluster-binding domain-containing protein [Vibrio lentus]